jgi:Protein of unknown function (DUF2510)
MRVEDAPPAGWYPDPEGGSRLRWWEGTDWSDRYRAPPTRSEVDRRALVRETHRGDDDLDVDVHQQRAQLGSLNRQDSEAIISQVRQAARAEAERAAGMFRQEARSAADNLTPLITEYTSKLVRWIRIASVIAVVLLIGWVAFQIFAQVSLFDWIGDRIDNISDNLNDDTGTVLGPLIT